MGHEMDDEIMEMSRIERVLRLGLLFLSASIVCGIGFLFHSVRAQDEKRVGARVVVSLIEEPSQGVMPTVAFRSDEKCDQAIVRTFYNVELPLLGASKDADSVYRTHTLLLSRTSVIPCFAGATVAADDVPAAKDKIVWVTVTFVKEVGTEKHTFEGR